MTVQWITDVVSLSEGALSRMASDGIKYALTFFGALALSLLLTPACRAAARRLGMIDQPSARRINKVPVPRGGGLAVFIAFQVTMGILIAALKSGLGQAFSITLFFNFLLASFLLVGIGLLDDKRGLRPITKLIGQISVATILYCSGVRLGGIIVEFPPWLDYLATVFWIVGAINAFNLIDGLDGLATGLAFIASVGLAGSLLFTGRTPLMLPYLALAGACLGFLRYNFHPASVFLGDTGSMFLGLCLSTFPLVTGTRKELVASLGVPLLAMGIPIFDTLLAIWRRTVRALLPQNVVALGERVHVMQPDKEHLHHRLLRETLNQRTAAIILYAVSGILVMIGFGGTLLHGRAPGLFLLAFMVAVCVIVRHLARVELWDTGRLLSQRRLSIRTGLLVPLSILWDVLWLCAIWFFVRKLAHLPITRSLALSQLPISVVPVFLFLVIGKTYWRVWSRAQIRDYAVLGLSLFGGAVSGLGLTWLLGADEENVALFSFRYFVFSVFPIVGVRLWLDTMKGVMQALERRFLLSRPDTLRVFVYGGGVCFRNFLRVMTESSGNNTRVIMGIIDDDVHLRGRIIAGYRVMGAMEDLPTLIQRMNVDGVVVTCSLDTKRLEEIARQVEQLGLLLSVWSCEERPWQQVLDDCSENLS